MSSTRQNERSPDQQIAEIRRRLQMLGYHWIIVQIYRDDGISGRLVNKRAGFRKMLADLRSGNVAADFILVDTFPRFGRAKEMAVIRQDLQDRFGILVLTAVSNFADPNTPQGRALGVVDNFLATEENQQKAHNIGRGKRDAVELKRWPGGTPPMGLMLQSVMKEENGRQVVDYSLLVPHPEERHIMALIFREADATGFGQTRLAKHLNAHPEIPDKFKPFFPSTVAHWLRDEIYIGTMVFGDWSTDIVNDTQVRRRNDEEQIIRVEGFCEAIVEPALFRRVKSIFDRRSAIHKQRNQKEPSGKLIEPLVRGLTLKYLMSGLVFCAHCGQRMTAMSSSVFVTKSGESRRYTSYVCPAHIAGNCTNGVHVPESWLRRTVIGQLRRRLFPVD
jgi:DNA invertase Pin-like site-specific DNA recombinase